MKPLHSILAASAVALISITLTACATDQTQDHSQHHPAAGNAPASAQGKHGGMSGMGMMNSDMAAMCNMQAQKMSAKTPEERRALMAQKMKSMSPEMKQKQMEMMRDHMKMMQEGMSMMQEHMGSQMPGNK